MFYLLPMEASTPPGIIASLHYLLEDEEIFPLWGPVRLLAPQLFPESVVRGSAERNVQLFNALRCVSPR